MRGGASAVPVSSSAAEMRIRTRLPIVFTVPTMAVLAVLAFVPTVDAINIALQNREFSNLDGVYVGFANFFARCSAIRPSSIPSGCRSSGR